MFVFIVRRVLISIPLIFVVMIGLFFLQQLAPGDASALYINPEFPIEQIERIRANLGLDQPSYVQFWRWFTAALSGDFGISLTENRPVIDKIIAALPNTLLLGGASLAVIFVIGIVVGVVSAVKQYSLTDHLLTLGSFFLYSMPDAWLPWLVFDQPSGDALSGVQVGRRWAAPRVLPMIASIPRVHTPRPRASRPGRLRVGNTQRERALRRRTGVDVLQTLPSELQRGPATKLPWLQGCRLAGPAIFRPWS